MAAETSKGTATQQNILAGAHQLFTERGYHGTSMRMIAQQAGIALGGIYNHFPNKESLFLAVLLAHHPYYALLPVLQASQGETLEEYIRDAAIRMVSDPQDRFEFTKLLFIELVEFRGQHLPQLFQMVFPDVLEKVGRYAQDHRARLRPIPTVSLIRAFIGLFFSYTITDMLIARQLPAEMKDNAVDHMIDIYLHGILKE